MGSGKNLSRQKTEEEPGGLFVSRYRISDDMVLKKSSKRASKEVKGRSDVGRYRISLDRFWSRVSPGKVIVVRNQKRRSAAASHYVCVPISFGDHVTGIFLTHKEFMRGLERAEKNPEDVSSSVCVSSVGELSRTLKSIDGNVAE